MTLSVRPGNAALPANILDALPAGQKFVQWCRGSTQHEPVHCIRRGVYEARRAGYQGRYWRLVAYAGWMDCIASGGRQDLHPRIQTY